MLTDINNINFSNFTLISKDNYIVWLKNANRYIVLDSKIFNLLNIKFELSHNDFLIEICKVLNIDSITAEKINIDIEQLLLESNQIYSKKEESPSQTLIDCKIIHFYSFNNIIIKVSFDSEDTKNLIHPKYKHLEVFNPKSFDINYNLFKKKYRIYIFKAKQLLGSWDDSEMHEFQGKFSMEFLCSTYNKNEHDWMGVFHASTISKNNQSIMFTGDSGNGKSTLVSILMAKGYNVISDDFTPILREDLKTYCFPTAISIKEKSFDMIESMHPEIADFKEYYINELKGNIKYLPPITNKINASCNSVVWVKYSKGSDNNLEKISKASALQKFLPEAWISNQEINAKAFMNWIVETRFYELNYSDNNELPSLIDRFFVD
ncbi:hypothetical protein N8376_06605 [Flavobacteriaceae bacterium]|nr:hypothetical protein [Flavobacteriaceae bacterium]MDC1493007.1 hypothetical protein [Flavobacteriaceae bacterium]